MAKEDRRVRRSKRLLSAAIGELVAEKPYKEINVKEITERADVGYMTFYRHYESKDHLLLYYARTMLEEALAPYKGDCNGIGHAVFRLVDENRRLFKVVLLDDSAVLVRRWLQDIISENMLEAPNLLPETEHASITNEIAAMHFASSALNLISWWLNRQYPYPIAQMGEIYQSLMLEPTLQAVRSTQITLDVITNSTA